MVARSIDNLSGVVSVAVMTDCADLARRFAALRGDVAFSPRPSALPLPLLVSGGCERQTDPRRYRWDGLRRGHDLNCPQGVPHAIVQYTLAGHGTFADAAGERRVTAGQAFIALVPSAHRYWLPEAGAPWTFCWFAVAHPQLVERLRLHVARAGATFAAAPDGAVAQGLVGIVEGLLRRSHGDESALEAALWTFVTGLDRQHERSAHPPAPKRALLEQVRELVTADLATPLGPADVAGLLGLHRVYFAERFRAATGFPPGAFITSLRLEEARRRLRETGEPLDAVARAVGFGSASQLCRVFRKHFGGTPGGYRAGTRTSGP